MKVKVIKSLQELKGIIAESERSFLLLYKSNSPTSGCAESSFEEAATLIGEALSLKADASLVRDIHPFYGVDSVPSLLIFEKSTMKNIIKGCQTTGFYKNLMENQLFQATSGTSGGPSVTVYSTPSCSWCTTLKNYLRQHKIQFTDIDVSADPEQARALVNKTGQTGVPQTEINGEMVIGFDKSKINRLLNING